MNTRNLLTKKGFFWRIFFASTIWPSYFYSLYLSKKYPLEPFRKYFTKKNVYCVGAGPSLDAIEIESINDSTVLLLNGAVKLNNLLNKSNEVIWMAQDVDVILDLKERIPPNIKKIIYFNTFKKAIFCSGLFKKNDGFCPPSTFIQIEHALIPVILVKKANVNEKLILSDLNRPFPRMPWTVMLNAIRIAASFQAKKIILTGFDLSHFGNDEKGGSYSNKTLTKIMKRRLLDSNFDEIELFLAKLYEELQEANIEIYNWSPLSKDKVLPRLEI